VLRLAADEDFDNDVVRGVLARLPAAGFVTVQGAGLSGATDVEILEWAAATGRVVITCDLATMGGEAARRVSEQLSMPGLFRGPRSLPIAEAIEELLVLIECSREGEWEGMVGFLPL
jgi:hypothetical protein